MIPSDRLMCVFVGNMHTGDIFIEWPLHITLVPWFRTEASSDDLARALGQRLDGLEPFMVTVGEETSLGRRRKMVNLIIAPTPLETIEQKTRELLRGHKAWMVDETTKIRRRFRPHITAQKSSRVNTGDTFMCDSLYIVEQKGNHKEIINRIDL